MRAIMGRFHVRSATPFNNRSSLGIEDAERASNAIKGGIGKRLTYRQPDKAKNA